MDQYSRQYEARVNRTPFRNDQREAINYFGERRNSLDGINREIGRGFQREYVPSFEGKRSFVGRQPPVDYGLPIKNNYRFQSFDQNEPPNEFRQNPRNYENFQKPRFQEFPFEDVYRDFKKTPFKGDLPMKSSLVGMASGNIGFKENFGQRRPPQFQREFENFEERIPFNERNNFRGERPEFRPRSIDYGQYRPQPQYYEAPPNYSPQEFIQGQPQPEFRFPEEYQNRIPLEKMRGGNREMAYHQRPQPNQFNPEIPVPTPHFQPYEEPHQMNRRPQYNEDPRTQNYIPPLNFENSRMPPQNNMRMEYMKSPQKQHLQQSRDNSPFQPQFQKTMENPNAARARRQYMQRPTQPHEGEIEAVNSKFQGNQIPKSKFKSNFTSELNILAEALFEYLSIEKGISKPRSQLYSLPAFNPQNLFSLGDPQGCGYLSGEGFREVLYSLGIELGGNEVSTIFSRFGKKISWQNFLSLFLGSNDKYESKRRVKTETGDSDEVIFRVTNEIIRGVAEQERILCQLRNSFSQDLDAMEIFKEIDFEKKGYITAREISKVMEKFGFTVNLEDTNILMKRLSKFNSGRINFNDFTELMGVQV